MRVNSKSSRIRILLILLFCLSAIFIPHRTVNAYYTYNGHKNSYGITYKKYWLQDSGSQIPTQWQAKYIDDAMYQWNSSSQSPIVTPMNVTRTTNRSESIMDFFFTHDHNIDVNDPLTVGLTQWFWWGTVIKNVNQNNWSSANIWFGGQSWYNLSALQKRNVFGHEIGHGVGLDHSSNGTIMYASVTSIYQPTRDDLLGVNYLYN